MAFRTLSGALDSEDTRVMIDGLRRLGIEVESHDAGTRLIVHGAGGEIPALEADLFCANSGTTIRFLTALATLGHGAFRLDGVERMRRAADRRFARGAQSTGCACWEREWRQLSADRCACERADRRHSKDSWRYIEPVSQWRIDGCAGATSPVELMIEGPLVSQPYMRMTLEVMKSFGACVETAAGSQQFQIAAPQAYRACEYAIEPDASAASYFWAAAAICGGEVTVEGLTADSLQGDVAFVDCLEKMGCEVRRDASGITVSGRPLRGIDVDMNAISDTVQTLAVVAIFAEGPTRIRHVGHIRHKETDRIAAVATELRKLGCRCARARRWSYDRPRQRAASESRNNRNVSRPSHGDEFCARWFAHPGRADRESTLRRKNVSAVLRRSRSVGPVRRRLLGPYRDHVRQHTRPADARGAGGLEQLFGPFQQRDAGGWRRIAGRAGIIGLKPGIAVLADDLLAQILDTDFQFPAASRAFLHKVRVTRHYGVLLLPTPRFPHESVQRRFSISIRIRKYNNLVR